MEQIQLGNRETVRVNSSRADESVKIELSKIIVKPGFNVRQDMGDVKSLAASILENGQSLPGRVDVLEDGTFILIDGHRRFEALKLIEQQGHECFFKAFVNNSKTTDEQRILQMFTTQDSKPLESHEVAELIQRLMNLGHTQKSVAQKIGKSQSYVSQMLDYASESPTIKKQVVNGSMTVSDAVKLKKQIPDQKERTERVKELSNKGESVSNTLKADKKREKAQIIASDIFLAYQFDKTDKAIIIDIIERNL